MLFYYITDRRQFPGTDADQRHSLLAKIAEAAAAGVDLIQLREKDLSAGALEQLAREVLVAIRQAGATTRLLINSRIDVALASGADGVHLTSTDISPADVRAVVAQSAPGSAPETRNFLVAVSCHSVEDVSLAESQGASFAALAPIFGKVSTGAPGIGLSVLREATQRPPVSHRRPFPVFALGGVTLANALSCIDTGAAGIAAIRLFQQTNIAELVRQLRPE